jgi:chorismate mutase-like protein
LERELLNFMAGEENSLDGLRREIDEIDSQIHDLLMRRTEVAQRIGAAKGDESVYMRPGREAVVLRRLIARHRGDLPKALIVRIWREVFAAVTALQGAFAAAVYAPEGTFGFRNLARDHYGWRTPITAYRSAAQVLEAVTEGRATVGVLPVPQDDDSDPWWRRLARDGETVPRIVARLPFAGGEPPGTDGPEALAITLSRTEETGLDRSFLVVESREVISRSRLKDLLGQADLTAADIQVAEEADRWLHLIEVEGFLADDDARIGRLLGLDEGTLVQGWAIGGYAVPLSLEEMTAPAGKQAAQ